jgi:hypothetical protein
MIWVAWRQFRTQALLTLGLLAVLAVLVIVTGLHLRDVYSSLGGAHCSTRDDCTALGVHDKALADTLGPGLVTIPALLGMFWGAPLLARELESGTYRLAWTQSVTRRRWLSVRVALVGLAALAVAGLASCLVSWWLAPLDAVDMNRFDPSVFGERGVVALGYAGFSFGLGIAAGALARRTLPAMVATLLGFTAARIAFTLWVRPHLLANRNVVFPVTLGKGVEFPGLPPNVSVVAAPPPIPNAWMISAAIVDRAHHAVGTAQLQGLLVRSCPSIAAGRAVTKFADGPASGVAIRCQVALSHHLQQLVTYKPPSDYWPLQALEAGLFLAAGLLLIACTLWRVGRRAAGKPAAGEPRQRTADPFALEVAPQVDVSGVPTPEDGENEQIMRLRRPRMLTAVIAVSAVSLLAAGCGGGGSPGVASLGSSTTPATASTAITATGNGALAYARCIRSHGVPNFPDPVSGGETNKRAVVSALEEVGSTRAQAAQIACMHVNGGSPGTGQGAAQSQAQTVALLAFARCLRSQGFPTFPDPTSSGQLTRQMLASAGIDLHDPAVVPAADTCTSVTHGVITKAVVARFVAGQ